MTEGRVPSLVQVTVPALTRRTEKDHGNLYYRFPDLGLKLEPTEYVAVSKASVGLRHSPGHSSFLGA
jgi:hypothetical protein